MLKSLGANVTSWLSPPISLMLALASTASAQRLPLDSVVEQPYAPAEVVDVVARKLLVGERLRGIRTVTVAQGVMALGLRSGPESPRVELYDLNHRFKPVALSPGQVPLEALWGLDVDKNGRDIWAFDPQGRTLTRIVIDRTSSSVKAKYAAPIRLDPGPLLTTAVFHQGQIWTTGIFVKGRIARFDTKGQLVDLIGATPASEQPDPLLASETYIGVLAGRPGGGLAVVACRLAGRVEIIDSSGSLVRLADVPRAFPAQPRLIEHEGRTYALYRPDRNLGYIDVHATDRYVYALFSGRTRTQARDRGSNGRFVHVFDWSGHRVAVLKLPHDARAIFVSPDDRQLYFVHSLPGEHYVAVAELLDVGRARPGNQ